ncbi:MAG: undecaprenyldiphospho-muramoylpentapeptide beta-N-acetylglucosaminyltransferase [Bacteroidales bacterium]|nr:undecaprenyldiphospho-muramoylpentapeptide beta-N-acetylglucosaminyltransferase [Bacteroidales bacterium]
METTLNSKLQRAPRLIVSGGGTGGHIFPAIAIADAFKRRHPDAEILFVGAKGKMEMDRVPKAGYPIEGLWISGFKRELSLDNLSFPFKLISSLVKARRILKRFKPDLVVGVGGFASGPIMRKATSLRIPVVIQEQNSYPGVTNKIVAPKASRICVAYDNMQRWFPEERIVLTGNPLRNNVVSIEGKHDEGARFFGLDPQKPIILLVGGSQGALGINKGISAKLAMFKDTDVQMIWQTGKHYIEQAQQEIKQLGLEDRVKPVVFIDRMDLAYASADVVISRAGAMSISELSLVGKAVVFVPLPTAAEDHQTKNAQSLVEKDAAIIVRNDETSEKLIPTVFELLADKKKIQRMQENIAKFARPNAAEDIVNELDKVLCCTF